MTLTTEETKAVNDRAAQLLKEWASQPKKRYVLEGGIHCPYCESCDLEWRGAQSPGSGVTRNPLNPGFLHRPMACRCCKASWTEVYELCTLKNVRPPSPHGAAPGVSGPPNPG